jgi:pilus assembly protein CpaE
MMVVDRLSAKMLQVALRAGVRDVLLLPVEEKQLVTAVHQVAKALNSSGVLQARRAAEPGRVVTVFSAKGGSGTTTVACNLAVALARRKQGPVTLVDADLQFGDASVMLQVVPEHTLVDVVGQIQRLDEQLLESSLVHHPGSGLRVLPAPVEPAAADQVLASDVLEIVQTLRSMGDTVVVDTPSVFNDSVLGLLDESDEVLLVAGLEIPSVKNLKLTIQTLRLLNVSMSKVRIVINRSASKANLDLREVERALQIKADALVPADVAVPQAVNKGQPVVLDAPRSAAARALEDLADQYARRPATPGP